MKRSIFTLATLLISSMIVMGQLKPGDEAVDFTLQNVDSRMVSLHDYADQKGVILIFTCNPCPFAKAYEQRIINLQKYYAKYGYPVVAINPNDETLSPDDTFRKMQQRAKEKEYNFPYLKDASQEVYKAYGATRTPHVFLLKNENGIFRVAFIGAIDNNAMDEKEVTEKYLENAIRAIELGNNPDPAEVRAIGCTIKSKS